MPSKADLVRGIIDDLEALTDKLQALLVEVIEDAKSPVGGCERLSDESGSEGHDQLSQQHDGSPGEQP